MTGSWPGGPHSDGMHEFIVREAEVGTRVALAEDEEACMGAGFRLTPAQLAELADRGDAADTDEGGGSVPATIAAAMAVIEAAPVDEADPAAAHDRWFRSVALPEQVEHRDRLMTAAGQTLNDALAQGDQAGVDAAGYDQGEAFWQDPARHDHDHDHDEEGDTWC